MKGRSTTQRIASVFGWARWGQHIAIVATYAACYHLTLTLSFPQWMLTAGVRLACLFLLPVRFWPALVLGEALPLLETSIMGAPDFGVPWAILQALPMVVLWIPLMKPLRRRAPVYDANGRVRMSVILWATLGTSIITALSTTLRLVLALRHTPGKWPGIVASDYFFAYLLGAYLGALTLTPMILALHERLRALGGQPLTPGVIWRSPLLRDMSWWALPALAALAWAALATHDDEVRLAAQWALLSPVVVLAWRHGWHGTAVGGMVASVALAITAQGLLDPATIRVQVFLALTLSVSLWLGARATRRSRSLTAAISRER